MDGIEKFASCERTIPVPPAFSWQRSRAMPIEESKEPLIPVSYCPEKILARPQYFYQKLPSALPEIYLREGVYDRLLKAAALLPQGCRLLVYDGWRPLELQGDLFEQYKRELKAANPHLDDDGLNEMTSRFVAVPSAETPSPHNTGGAVDLTVVDAGGKILDMGAEFDETSEFSETVVYEKRFSEGQTLTDREKRALKHRRLLFHAMAESGFTNYPGEWWHYDFGNQNWALLGGHEKALYGPSSPSARWK